MNKVASKKLEVYRPLDWEMEGVNLSSFLNTMHDQQLASFVNARKDFDFLDKIDQCFLRFIKNHDNPESFLEAAIFARAHSFYRAACGTALAGQCVETFAIIRPMIESSAVALMVHKKPKLSKTFLQRHDNEATLKASKTEFHPSELEKIVKSADALIGRIYKDLYNRCIDFGSHPNERALSSGMRVIEEGDETIHQIFYSHPGTLSHKHALDSLQQAGVCSLKIFQFIFPEKFLLLKIDDEIREMIKNFNSRTSAQSNL